MRSRTRQGFIALSLLLLTPWTWAHGIHLFATVEGSTVQGTLRYADGTPAAKAPVRAYAPDGEVIAEATTDETGRFEFQARIRVRHRLVGDAGQGHRGLFTLAAEELPASLPEPGALTSAESTPLPLMRLDSPPADFDARLEAAVARQLRPLREQMDGYEKRIRIRDVLGGIGYLFGLAGLLVLVKHRNAGRAD